LHYVWIKDAQNTKQPVRIISILISNSTITLHAKKNYTENFYNIKH